MFHRQQDDILPKRNRADLLSVSGLQDDSKLAHVKVLVLGRRGRMMEFWLLLVLCLHDLIKVGNLAYKVCSCSDMTL